MTAGSKACGQCFFLPDENIRMGPHAPRNEYRLTWKRTGSTLPVNNEPVFFTIECVLFDFCNVVCYIINNTKRSSFFAQNTLPCLSHFPCNELPIRPRKVCPS